MSPTYGLKGKIALIAGADRGVGYATAWAIAQQGGKVILTGQGEENLQHLAQMITQSTNLPAIALAGRGNDETFAHVVFKRIMSEHGRLDILVNDSAFAKAGEVELMPVAELRRHLEQAVVAPYIWMQKAVAMMKSNGPAGGKIVMVGSVRGAWVGPGGWGGDNAGYAGLRAMCESIARQMHDQGLPVAVSLFTPGLGEAALTDLTPTSGGIPAEQAARAILHALTAPADLNVFETVLYPLGGGPWVSANANTGSAVALPQRPPGTGTIRRNRMK
jgi:3-oxoacyl-[acyl-carrier protein] reductase